MTVTPLERRASLLMTTLLTRDGQTLLCQSGNVVCPKCSTASLHAIHTSTADACLQNILHASGCKDELCSCREVKELMQHVQNCPMDWDCGFLTCNYTKLILKHKSVCTSKECKLCSSSHYYEYLTKHYSVSVPLNRSARFDGGVGSHCEAEGSNEGCNYIKRELERENRILQERLRSEKQEVERLSKLLNTVEEEKKELEKKALEVRLKVQRRLVSDAKELDFMKDKAKRLHAECSRLRDEVQRSNNDQVKRLQAECMRLKDELARSETAKIEYFNRVQYLETCKNVTREVIVLT